jgi:hypothetical protein
MATKRATKATKRAKKVKNLAVKNTSARQAKNVKGGDGIEINSWSFGVGRSVSPK